MLAFCKKCWNENKITLKRKLCEMGDDEFQRLDYRKLVEYVVEYLLNVNTNDVYNSEDITEIDNGSHQGTLIYLIPLRTYQPMASEYLATFIEYGSCSVCDALYGIQSTYATLTEQAVTELLEICAIIVNNICQPFRKIGG